MTQSKPQKKECETDSCDIKPDCLQTCWKHSPLSPKEVENHIKSFHSEPKEEKEWEEEYYRFCERILNDFKNKRKGFSEFIELNIDFIKTHFISRKEMLEKIEGMRKMVCDCSCDPKKGDCLMFSYNNALSDVKKILES